MSRASSTSDILMKSETTAALSSLGAVVSPIWPKKVKTPMATTARRPAPHSGTHSDPPKGRGANPPAAVTAVETAPKQARTQAKCASLSSLRTTCMAPWQTAPTAAPAAA